MGSYERGGGAAGKIISDPILSFWSKLGPKVSGKGSSIPLSPP